MKKKYQKLGLIASVLVSCNVMAQTPGYDGGEDHHIIEEERGRNIARQISDSIYINVSDQLLAEENPLYTAGLGQTPLAASADKGSVLDSVWTNVSWTEISNDGLAAQGDDDIYQFTAGVDKRFGNLFVGLTTSYAYTENEVGGVGSQGDIHTVDVTPYAAFVLTKNIFLSATTGYSYTRSEPDVVGVNNDKDRDEYKTELTINGVKSYDNLFIKARAGGRYRHTDDYFDAGNGAGLDNDQDEWTYLVDAEVGYIISKGLRFYGGALYEYVEKEDGEDDGVLYMSTGIDYSVSKALTVGLKYRTDANNEDVDFHTVGLNLNLAL